jgi:hypothetical protein
LAVHKQAAHSPHGAGPNGGVVFDVATIKLGHHGKHLHAGQEVEPAVSITRNGKGVSDAKVFNSLLSADGKTVLVKRSRHGL